MTSSYPGLFDPVSEGPWDRPAVTDDLDLCPRTCWVDQLSRPTRSRVRADMVSTSCPGRLGHGSEELWGGPAIPGDSVPCLS